MLTCLFGRYPFERDEAGNIPEDEALVYAVELLCGVEHIALCGYAHMDVKPGNLLVTEARGGAEGEIQILLGDFGTVVRRTDHLRANVFGSLVGHNCLDF